MLLLLYLRCCSTSSSLLVLQTVQAFKAANPHISNLQKLSNRIKRDLLFVTRQQQEVQEQQGSSEQQADLEQFGGLTESRLQVCCALVAYHVQLLFAD